MTHHLQNPSFAAASYCAQGIIECDGSRLSHYVVTTFDHLSVLTAAVGLQQSA